MTLMICSSLEGTGVSYWWVPGPGYVGMAWVCVIMCECLLLGVASSAHPGWLAVPAGGTTANILQRFGFVALLSSQLITALHKS